MDQIRGIREPVCRRPARDRVKLHARGVRSIRGNGARRPVSRVLSAPWGRGTAIPLRRASRRASRDQPGRRSGKLLRLPPCSGSAGRPYSVLLPVGFTLPPPLPGARCALAAPFHPCPRRLAAGAGGFLSVALSLGSPPPAVSRHRLSRGARTFLQHPSPGVSGRPAVWPGSDRPHGALRQHSPSPGHSRFAACSAGACRDRRRQYRVATKAELHGGCHAVAEPPSRRLPLHRWSRSGSRPMAGV
jgi:hypothetical protein